MRRLTREDKLTYLAHACRGMAYTIRTGAEKHKGCSTYEKQIAEAEIFEALAKECEEKKLGG